MEKIYDPKNYATSEHINIKEFLEKYKSSIDKNIFSTTPSEHQNDFSAAFHYFEHNFSGEEQKQLIESCSIKNLDIENEMEPIDIKKLSFSKIVTTFKPFEGPMNLNTIRKKKKNAFNLQYKLTVYFELAPPADHKSLIDLNPGEHVVITLSVMRPFKYTFADQIPKSRMKLFKDVTLLGSNTLAEFRDKIDCPADVINCKEVSENPDFDLNYPSNKEEYPSGFFFIDNIFYNDFRKINSIDYSEVLRKWGVEKKIGNFSTAEMFNTRFDQLSPRIGYPYVYQHKGCCEHIFIFSQIRLLNSSDTLCSVNYPYYNRVARTKDKYCIICGNKVATWLVKQCEILPQANALLCSVCFKSYCYIDGKKICNFQAYPFSNIFDV